MCFDTAVLATADCFVKKSVHLYSAETKFDNSRIMHVDMPGPAKAMNGMCWVLQCNCLSEADDLIQDFLLDEGNCGGLPDRFDRFVAALLTTLCTCSIA